MSAARTSLPAWKRRRRNRRLAQGAITVAIVLVALFPIVWGLSTSLKTPAELAAFPPTLLPRQPTL